MAEAIAEEYRSSLMDLNFNSKPHINMLTILAEENAKFATVIVDTILTHIEKVQPDMKLPSLYLVDSIMKNIGGQYITLFSKHMITLFSSVFEKVEETTRSALYKLRQTWNDILPKNILYGIDCQVHSIDPAWPITAVINVPVNSGPSKNPIHVNPKFLGGPNTGVQNASATKNEEKPADTVKTEPITKETEVIEMKKKQGEMLKLFEEKKNQLKALQLKAIEQKKLEIAKFKKSAVLLNPVPPPVAPRQTVQKKILSHRDPRLKKSMPISQATDDLKGSDKSTVAPLQSVVIVPNTKLPSDAVANNGNVATAKTKDGKPNVLASNTLHPAAIPKSAKNNDKTHKDIAKEKPNLNRDPLNRNFKGNKKHSTSPENKLGVTAKRFCKQSPGKTKRLHSQEDNLPLRKNESPLTKKPKNELSKAKNKRIAGPRMGDDRLSDPLLFGAEDKDYRHQVRNDNRLQSKRWPHSKTMHSAKSISQKAFNPIDHNSTSVSTPEENPYLHENVVEHNSVTNKICVETYIPPNLDNFVAVNQKLKDARLAETQNFKLEDNLDKNYVSKHVTSNERLPRPSTTSIMLDGKNRIIHFVEDRALTVMDNNDPREVSFVGLPRNVYVEGLTHPFLLEFGGRQVEFLTEGKINALRFGTPSREIYVNNIPYEAKFGGPPIKVLLEDHKEHKIQIDGPPPQVVLSEKPAYELFEHFNRINRKSNQNELEDATLFQDVDMRVKSSHILQPPILPECKKDIDWRHVQTSSDPSQIPWNMPQNSFETPPSARNFTPAVPNMPNNSNPNNWPHPGYREVVQQNERPPFEQPMHMDQKSQHIPPNAVWDQARPPSSLPPPPSIPLSLNLSNRTVPAVSSALSQMSNLGVPPSSWNPLPPPPMFSGSMPESINMISAGSNSNPALESVVSAPTLPINVETIYEKLVAAGIISKKTEEPKISKDTTIKEEKMPEEEEEIEIPEMRLSPKTLRQFSTATKMMIARLYEGTQCATCGMRFKEIQSEQYSRHLDWHFRMNRREKDGAKKAYSRRWYYEVKDWIQFKEIEEAEERTPSYFELQADGEVSKSEEKENFQSVPASECESEKCSVCGEQFQLFWVEEEEEWHLKHAVRHDGEAYHPMCYEDHKKAIELANRPVVPEEPVNDPVKEKEEPMSVNVKVEETEEGLKSEEIKVEDIKDEIKLEDVKQEIKVEEDIKQEMKVEECPGEDQTENAEKTPIELPGEEKVLEESAISTKESEDLATMETGEEASLVKESGKLEPGSSSTEGDVLKTETPEVSVPENKDAKTNSVVESEDSLEEFRPPTPDPRFEVQPPVFKGTELSALCTIM